MEEIDFEEVDFLEEKSIQIREDLLKMIFNSGMGHTGASLSNTDILTTLYYSILNIKPEAPQWPQRDRFVLSKGHGVESYYCILADLDFFPREELDTFCQYQTRLIGHPSNKVPGVEINTGALGHGLAISVGMAQGLKMDKKEAQVFTLMGDGEQAEGSIWEAAMAGSNFNLDNLTGIIDRNRLQITGNTEKVMKLEPLKDKWESFGWEVIEVDGHDHKELLPVFNSLPLKKGKPSLIIANTVKGKGVSFIENRAEWHHKVPAAEELKSALAELSRKRGGNSRD